MVSTTKIHDAVILGAGPGGAATALSLLEAGVTPLILDKESFPRYHIGESLTGEVGGTLRKLGLGPKMDADGHPIKHGVKVYGTAARATFFVQVQERTAENTLSPQQTWQVRRSTFDKMLLEEAIRRGADYRTGEALTPIMDGTRMTGVRVRTPGGADEDIRARVVVDASGQSTFLASRGVTSRPVRGTYDKQVAIFSQVANTNRDPGGESGNTIIFYRQRHYWAWFIPLDDEVVSVGVVAPAEYFKAQKLSQADFLHRELHALNPELQNRVPDRRFVEEVRAIRTYSYRIADFAGDGWLCVGDSHRFIDPIFSFGLGFAMKEGQLAAESIVRHLGGAASDPARPFADYARSVDRAQDIVEDLVDCFWDHPVPFLMFVHYSLRDHMTDLFAGRLYGDAVQQSPAVTAMRRRLGRLPQTEAAAS